MKHLKSAITVDDLEHFVKPVLKGGLLQKRVELKAIKIVSLINKKGMVIERHGLVRISPNNNKARLIKKLNSKNMNQEKFAVAEYIIRHWSNDRRSSSHVSDLPDNNRRTNDRRSNGLRILTMSEKLDF